MSDNLRNCEDKKKKRNGYNEIILLNILKLNDGACVCSSDFGADEETARQKYIANFNRFYSNTYFLIVNLNDKERKEKNKKTKISTFKSFAIKENNTSNQEKNSLSVRAPTT